MNNIILGFSVIIIFSMYLFFLLKRRGNTMSQIWSVSMLFKGLAGAVSFIIIGIILVVKGCNSL